MVFFFICSILGENCCLAPSAFNQFVKVEPQSTSVRNMFHLAQSKIFTSSHFIFMFYFS